MGNLRVEQAPVESPPQIPRPRTGRGRGSEGYSPQNPTALAVGEVKMEKSDLSGDGHIVVA